MKAEGQLLKLGSLSEQVQGLQSAIEDKDSLITRMRAEQQLGTVLLHNCLHGLVVLTRCVYVYILGK